MAITPSQRGDPFFQQIIQRLNEHLNPHLFEECVSDLLRLEHPGLVPIPGGSDMGMDGAFMQGAEYFCPLVTTIEEDVIGNLTKNLASYLGNDLPGRKVVIATNQALSQRKRKNLINRAEELGFQLVQIHDQLKIANLLYRDPRWCEELLGLTGNPPPLSTIPPRPHHFIEIEPIAREDEIAWLLQETGDKLLVGQPGIGKTFLLQRVALDGFGLFVVSNDLSTIANAVREQQPKVLMIDDAHLNIKLLQDLLRIRREIGADYSLVASCWPHYQAEVEQILKPPAENIRVLNRMTRETMVRVVQEMGLKRPDEHIAFILNQAEGRPGLAAVLVWAYLNGDWERLDSGSTVVDSTLHFIERDKRQKAKAILAAFSLGGDAGLDVMTVAREMNETPTSVWELVSELASGGVVYIHDKWISVRPQILREALVKEIFFSSNPLPLGRLPDSVPSVNELTLTLVGARFRGGAVDLEMLISFLEVCDKGEPWEAFCWLGEFEARWVIENHPEWTIKIAPAALENAPNLAIPKLLHRSRGDQRVLQTHPDHPLRQLSDWIKKARPGTNHTIRRRRAIIDSLMQWFKHGEDNQLGLSALEFAFSPAYEESRIDPGAGRTVTFYSGTVTIQEMKIIQSWWSEVFALLNTIEIDNWSPIRRLIESWAYPSRHGSSPSEEIRETMQSFASIMLKDIVSVNPDRLGLLLWASQLADHLLLSLDVQVDEEFEILYGDNPRDGFENWKDSEATRQGQIKKIASSWSKLNPDEIANRISIFEKAVQSVSNHHPHRPRMLYEEIAHHAGDPIEWANTFLKKGLDGEIITPFLKESSIRDIEAYTIFATENINHPSVSREIKFLTLRLPNPPLQLLNDIIDQLSDDRRIGERLTIYGGISDTALTKLLDHKDPAIAGAAALCEWSSEPYGIIREELSEKCRAAILNLDANSILNDHQKYELMDVLQSDPSLSFEWLRNRLNDENADYFSLSELMIAAVSVLSPVQRNALISLIPSAYFVREFVFSLVGDDLNLYQSLLNRVPRYFVWVT